MKEIGLAVALTLLLLTSVPAQRQWTVGADDAIAPVLEAAGPGDRIVIDGAHHEEHALSISKSIELVGAEGSTTIPGLTVSDLPRRVQVVVRGVVVVAGAVIRNCEGTVAFVDSEIGPHQLLWWRQYGGLRVYDSQHVQVERCSISNRPLFGGTPDWMVQLWGSELTLIDSEVFWPYASEYTSTLATIWLRYASRLVVVGSVVHGPHGWGGGFSKYCRCHLSARAGQPAIRADGGVFVTGGSVIYGGAHGDSQNPYRPYPIEVPGARVSADSQLIGTDYPGIRRIADQPRLFVDGKASIGGTVTATIEGVEHDLAAVLVDLRSHGPRFIPGTDLPFWLTDRAWLAGAGTIPFTGEVEFQVAIPNEPALAFSGLWMEALTLAPGASQLGISGLRVVPVE